MVGNDYNLGISDMLKLKRHKIMIIYQRLMLSVNIELD